MTARRENPMTKNEEVAGLIVAEIYKSTSSTTLRHMIHPETHETVQIISLDFKHNALDFILMELSDIALAILDRHYPPVPEDAVTNIINYFVWDGEHMDEAREYVRQQFPA